MRRGLGRFARGVVRVIAVGILAAFSTNAERDQRRADHRLHRHRPQRLHPHVLTSAARYTSRVSYRLALALVALALVLAGCSSESAGQVRRAMSTFTCCTGHDADKIYRPGAVVTLHWIRQTTYRLASGRPTRLTLEAEIDGAFATVAQAKAPHAHGSEQVRAAPVRVTDGTIAAPVSRLRIPADASPGLYNLTTTVDFGSGSTAAGTTTIRVAAH